MKLSRLTIISVGFFLGLVGVAFAVFQHVIPNIEDTRNQNELAQQLRSEIAKAPQVRRRMEGVVEKLEEQAATWNRLMSYHSVPGSLAEGGIDLAVNEYQLTVDARRFRNSVQRQLNRQLKVGGVEVDGPEIPFPTDEAAAIQASYFNYSTFGFPVVLYNLGQVTVRGTYAQIMRNVRAWSEMPNFLAVADGLQISGTSPNMTGTYNLTLVGFIRSEAVFPPVAGMGAAAAPAAAGGGFPGGPAAGPPGMRGGGFGADDFGDER